MANFDALMKDQPAQEDNGAVVDRTDIDSVMRRIFEKARGDVDAPATAKDAIEHKLSTPRRDYDAAFELLDRVAKTFDLLVSRFQRMQRELDVQAERAVTKIAEQEHAIEQWKQIVLDLKNQVEGADVALGQMQAKCEVAEARADVAEKRAVSMESASHLAADQAFQAERLSTKLHDKVVTVFGIGSRAHAVLEAVATSATD